MGRVRTVFKNNVAIEANDEILRLNALITNLRGQICELRGEVERLSMTADDAIDFVAEISSTNRDSSENFADILVPEEVAPRMPSIAEAAAAAAVKLAIAATRDGEQATILLPYQIYCDRLTFIKGIDISTAKLLADLGITRFMDIAALNAEDIAELNGMLGEPRRITKQGWIAQAAVLARGDMTRYASGIECPEDTSDIWATTAPSDIVGLEAVTVEATVEANKSASVKKPRPETNQIILLDMARRARSRQLGTAIPSAKKC